jgi:hypothetical protein
MIPVMRHPLTTLIVVLSTVATSFAAQPDAKKTEFLRFTKDAATDAGKLESAVAHYENAKGQKVDLVGAVHIGDAAYYKELNTRFKTYDAVLYEMVKPIGAGVPESGAPPRSFIGGMQLFMTRALDLTYQLDEVDYSAANFVHADLDTEAFVRAMEARGESMLSLMLRAMLNGMNRPVTATNNPDVQLGQLLFALQASDRSRQLKLFLGQQFHDIDEQVAMFEGPDGSAILADRNEAAMKVLKDELKTDKKTFAIFYGAAHLKGMEQILTKQMGFKRSGEEWLTAWNIPPAPKGAAIGPATRPAM